MIFQHQMQLGGLPITLVLVGNREESNVVFVPVGPIPKAGIYDLGSEVDVAFLADSLHFMSVADIEGYKYNTLYDYKNLPLMRKWLQQQSLQQPE